MPTIQSLMGNRPVPISNVRSAPRRGSQVSDATVPAVTPSLRHDTFLPPSAPLSAPRSTPTHGTLRHPTPSCTPSLNDSLPGASHGTALSAAYDSTPRPQRSTAATPPPAHAHGHGRPTQGWISPMRHVNTSIASAADPKHTASLAVQARPVPADPTPPTPTPHSSAASAVDASAAVRTPTSAAAGAVATPPVTVAFTAPAEARGQQAHPLRRGGAADGAEAAMASGGVTDGPAATPAAAAQPLPHPALQDIVAAEVARAVAVHAARAARDATAAAQTHSDDLGDLRSQCAALSAEVAALRAQNKQLEEQTGAVRAAQDGTGAVLAAEQEKLKHALQVEIAVKVAKHQKAADAKVAALDRAVSRLLKDGRERPTAPGDTEAPVQGHHPLAAAAGGALVGRRGLSPERRHVACLSRAECGGPADKCTHCVAHAETAEAIAVLKGQMAELGSNLSKTLEDTGTMMDVLHGCRDIPAAHATLAADVDDLRTQLGAQARHIADATNKALTVLHTRIDAAVDAKLSSAQAAAAAAVDRARAEMETEMGVRIAAQVDARCDEMRAATDKRLDVAAAELKATAADVRRLGEAVGPLAAKQAEHDERCGDLASECAHMLQMQRELEGRVGVDARAAHAVMDSLGRRLADVESRTEALSQTASERDRDGDTAVRAAAAVDTLRTTLHRELAAQEQRVHDVASDLQTLAASVSLARDDIDECRRAGPAPTAPQSAAVPDSITRDVIAARGAIDDLRAQHATLRQQQGTLRHDAAQHTRALESLCAAMRHASAARGAVPRAGPLDASVPVALQAEALVSELQAQVQREGADSGAPTRKEHDALAGSVADVAAELHALRADLRLATLEGCVAKVQKKMVALTEAHDGLAAAVKAAEGGEAERRALGEGLEAVRAEMDKAGIHRMGAVVISLADLKQDVERLTLDADRRRADAGLSQQMADLAGHVARIDEDLEKYAEGADAVRDVEQRLAGVVEDVAAIAQDVQRMVHGAERPTGATSAAGSQALSRLSPPRPDPAAGDACPHPSLADDVQDLQTRTANLPAVFTQIAELLKRVDALGGGGGGAARTDAVEDAGGRLAELNARVDRLTQVQTDQGSASLDVWKELARLRGLVEGGVHAGAGAADDMDDMRREVAQVGELRKAVELAAADAAQRGARVAELAARVDRLTQMQAGQAPTAVDDRLREVLLDVNWLKHRVEGAVTAARDTTDAVERELRVMREETAARMSGVDASLARCTQQQVEDGKAVAEMRRALDDVPQHDLPRRFNQLQSDFVKKTDELTAAIEGVHERVDMLDVRGAAPAAHGDAERKGGACDCEAVKLSIAELGHAVHALRSGADADSAARDEVGRVVATLAEEVGPLRDTLRRLEEAHNVESLRVDGVGAAAQRTQDEVARMHTSVAEHAAQKMRVDAIEHAVQDLRRQWQGESDAVVTRCAEQQRRADALEGALGRTADDVEELRRRVRREDEAAVEERAAQQRRVVQLAEDVERLGAARAHPAHDVSEGDVRECLARVRRVEARAEALAEELRALPPPVAADAQGTSTRDAEVARLAAACDQHAYSVGGLSLALEGVEARIAAVHGQAAHAERESLACQAAVEAVAKELQVVRAAVHDAPGPVAAAPHVLDTDVAQVRSQVDRVAADLAGGVDSLTRLCRALEERMQRSEQQLLRMIAQLAATVPGCPPELCDVPPPALVADALAPAPHDVPPPAAPASALTPNRVRRVRELEQRLGLATP